MSTTEQRPQVKVRRQVRRGAELLDERCPGWDSGVDLSRLDMQMWCDCVVGQVFGGHAKGRDALGFSDWGVEWEDHGFNLELDEWDRDDGRLTEEWRDLIAERR